MVVIGNVMGYGQSVTTGIVSARTYFSKNGEETYSQDNDEKETDRNADEEAGKEADDDGGISDENDGPGFDDIWDSLGE